MEQRGKAAGKTTESLNKVIGADGKESKLASDKAGADANFKKKQTESLKRGDANGTTVGGASCVCFSTKGVLRLGRFGRLATVYNSDNYDDDKSGSDDTPEANFTSSTYCKRLYKSSTNSKDYIPGFANRKQQNYRNSKSK